MTEHCSAYDAVAKKRYQGCKMDGYDLDASLFLPPSCEDSVDQEALKDLLVTSNLSVKFYRVEVMTALLGGNQR